MFYEENISSQQVITFRNIGKQPKFIGLPDIPPVKCWALDNGEIIRSYKKLSVNVFSIEQEGIRCRINKQKDFWTLAHSNYLDDVSKKNWQLKWVKYYHVGLINDAKIRLGEKLDALINPPVIWVTSDELIKLRRELKFYQRCYSWFESLVVDTICVNTICFLIRQDKILSIIFWVYIIIGRYSIDDNGDLQPNR